MQCVNVVPCVASSASAGASASLNSSPGMEQARCWSLNTNSKFGLRALCARAVAVPAARPARTSLRVGFRIIMTRVFYQPPIRPASNQMRSWFRRDSVRIAGSGASDTLAAARMRRVTAAAVPCSERSKSPIRNRIGIVTPPVSAFAENRATRIRLLDLRAPTASQDTLKLQITGAGTGVRAISAGIPRTRPPSARRGRASGSRNPRAGLLLKLFHDPGPTSSAASYHS